MHVLRIIAIAAACLAGVMHVGAQGQVDEICREFGAVPSLDSPWAQVPYVYGRISFKGVEGGRHPTITVTLLDTQRNERRLTVERSGNYCFRRNGMGGILVVEVDGVEVVRRSLATFGSPQQREDFEVFATVRGPVPPGAVSAKFSRPPNDKTTELYRKAAAAERNDERAEVVALLRQIVALDPHDFIAWAKLGVMLTAQNDLAEADKALRRSLEQRIDYTPAWTSVGSLRMAQKQYEAAVEILKHALTLEPGSASIYQMLGEAYLQSRQGTLGAQALNKAIELDPTGMAECHLKLAHLYQLAGAPHLAAAEYKLFLGKVPNYPDRKKLEKFIREHPEKK